MWDRGPRATLAWAFASVFSLALAPSRAAADVRDDVFAATLAFDQAYGGTFRVVGPDDDRGALRPLLGASLRLEVLFAEYLALGAAGGAAWWQPGGGTALDPGARHPVADASGFLRVRFALDDGTGEYYVVVGGGPSWLLHESGEADAYGSGVSAGDAFGFHLYARAGVRAELVDGFGALLELGWMRRQHDDALRIADDAGEGVYRWVSNQMSFVIAWYVAL